MANYPGSAPSFTAKSAGQSIASAHINSLQDEVTAIGAGLLQGTAQLNSSNSTVASLSVLGQIVSAGRQNVTLSTGNTNNLAIDSTATYIRITANSSGSTLTGIQTAGGFHRVLFISNVSANSFVMAHADAGSNSTNQLAMAGAASRTIKTGDGIALIYDVATGFWRSLVGSST